MIYLFQELDLISNELLHQMIFSLPVARREYVQHFKLPEDQKRSALAWLLLRYGLKQEYGFREIPDFQKTSSGKPFFRGENMPFFNLSHSGNFVGCALHDREIGLDIQKLTEPRESLIRRVCTQEELIFLKVPPGFLPDLGYEGKRRQTYRRRDHRKFPGDSHSASGYAHPYHPIRKWNRISGLQYL